MPSLVAKSTQEALSALATHSFDLRPSAGYSLASSASACRASPISSSGEATALAADANATSPLSIAQSFLSDNFGDAEGILLGIGGGGESLFAAM